VRSAYPAVAIFAMNRVEGAVTPLQSNAAEDALITRPDMEVAVRLLPPGGAAFLKTLVTAERWARLPRQLLPKLPPSIFRPTSRA